MRFNKERKKLSNQGLFIYYVILIPLQHMFCDKIADPPSHPKCITLKAIILAIMSVIISTHADGDPCSLLSQTCFALAQMSAESHACIYPIPLYSNLKFQNPWQTFDDLIFFKRTTTSMFWKMKGNLNYLENNLKLEQNGRWPTL